MINKYEARLGTERMLPLVFKMALPAVVAQFVNLLYSMVDRIYIGHIPGIGTDALAGVGVTTSLVILISSFSAIVGGGGAPLAAMALGQGDRLRAGKILGNGFVLLILFKSGKTKRAALQKRCVSKSTKTMRKKKSGEPGPSLHDQSPPLFFHLNTI